MYSHPPYPRSHATWLSNASGLYHRVDLASNTLENTLLRVLYTSMPLTPAPSEPRPWVLALVMAVVILVLIGLSS
jgi:hypothetical protein